MRYIKYAILLGMYLQLGFCVTGDIGAPCAGQFMCFN